MKRNKNIAKRIVLPYYMSRGYNTSFEEGGKNGRGGEGKGNIKDNKLLQHIFGEHIIAAK